MAAELRAEARTARHLRGLEDFLTHFEQTGRLAAPSHAVCMAAGEILARIGRPSDALLADVLIAMTARGMGAEVWTLNSGDFEAMRSALPFRLRIFGA